MSQRASVNDAWGPLQNLGPNINSDSNESAPAFSPDQHHLYFHSFKTGGCGGADLYVARRQDKRNDLGWEPAENLGCVVNSTANDAGPTIFEDEATGITLRAKPHVLDLHQTYHGERVVHREQVDVDG